MNIFYKILFLLPSNLRKRGILLLFILLITSLLDIIGIVSIFPFITILTNPEIIETNLILDKIFKITLGLAFKALKTFLFL